mmetsp:Transcript_6012/g.8759  ORF Transcript_6012/g.8759 Transcript_6012/m.8759 type:complete len:132 (-) Transcript_6012:347-742(-)
MKLEQCKLPLVLPKARSRIAGYYSLPQYGHYRKTSFNSSKTNSPILIECRTLRNVVTSAAEAEVGGVFHNAKQIIIIRRILEILGHPQGPTKLITDNSTVHGFVHDNIHLKNRKHRTCGHFGYEIKSLTRR